MLRPARSANHDCKPKAQLKSSGSYEEVKMIALRKIWAGEEITILYDIQSVLEVDIFDLKQTAAAECSNALCHL
jgi:hypothetical protein